MKLFNIKFILLSLAVFLSHSFANNNNDVIKNSKKFLTKNNSPEIMLLDAIKNIAHNKSDYAKKQLNLLTKKYTNYTLPKIILHDLNSTNKIINSEKLKDYKQQLAITISYLKKKENYFFKNKIPAEIISMSKDFRYAILVEAKNNRLFLFENQNSKPKLINSFYSSIGKNGFNKYVEGDKKTPIGTYIINKYIKPETLDINRYGTVGALSINYPNLLDKYHKKTGYGIWFHGTPVNSYDRVPLASDGCISVADNYMSQIKQYINRNNALVVITPKAHWLDEKTWQAQKIQYLALLNKWANDWESMNIEKYMSNYSHKLKIKNMTWNKFKQYKKYINKNKKFIDLALNNISIIKQGNYLLTAFEQNYKSDNYSSYDYKHIYWQKNNNNWKILLEQSKIKNNNGIQIAEVIK